MLQENEFILNARKFWTVCQEAIFGADIMSGNSCYEDSDCIEGRCNLLTHVCILRAPGQRMLEVSAPSLPLPQLSASVCLLLLLHLLLRASRN